MRPTKLSGCGATISVASTRLVRSEHYTSHGLLFHLPAPCPKIPSIGNFGLIDLETPKEAFVKHSHRDGSKMVLVFSDEFNTDGRSFYPGDDPYWEASDLHYWVGGMWTFVELGSRFLPGDQQHGVVRPLSHHNCQWLPRRHVPGQRNP